MVAKTNGVERLCCSQQDVTSSRSSTFDNTGEHSDVRWDSSSGFKSGSIQTGHGTRNAVVHEWEKRTIEVYATTQQITETKILLSIILGRGK